MSNIQSSGKGDITVCSVQSLSQSDRLTKFNPEQAKLILIEARHAVTDTYCKILDYFGASTKKSKVVVIGISAMLSRMDGYNLGNVFDKVVYHHDYYRWLPSLTL